MATIACHAVGQITHDGGYAQYLIFGILLPFLP
jgi:hypothetical protein